MALRALGGTGGCGSLPLHAGPYPRFDLVTHISPGATPLLWQIAVRLATAQLIFTWRAGLAWLLTALLIGLALSVGGPASSSLLGILATSLLWQVRERATGSTDLGAFGQLALALLLAEVDVTLHPLGPFLGSLFVGAGFGLLLGYIGVRVAFRLPVGEIRNLFCLSLAYLAYLVGAMPRASGVVTATMTALDKKGQGKRPA